MPRKTTTTGRSAVPSVGLRRAPRTPALLVPRPRLFKLLDSGTRKPLTLVIGPAGTGKTVLLSSWLEQSRSTRLRRARWNSPHDGISVEELLLIAAGVDAEDAAALTAGKPGVASPRVHDALVQRFDDGHRPDLLIVDDAHLLPPSTVALLARVLTTRPEAVNLLIGSRRDLAVPVLELELKDAATTVRAGQLRFTPDESERLVRQHSSHVSPAAIVELARRADGWAAALVLGAHAVAGVSEPEAIRSALGGTDQPVLDFLLGEAFAALSDGVKELLLSTFEEPELTGLRAVVLTGRSDAGALLSDLAADGLLVTAYAGQSTSEMVYSYHPLLVELLRRRITADSGDVSTVADAHLRAARYDAAQGKRASALRHAIASHEPQMVAELLVEHGPALLTRGDLEVVAQAQDELGYDAMTNFPFLRGIVGLYRRAVGDVGGAVVLAAHAQETGATMPAETVTESLLRDAVRADAMILQLWQTHLGWQDASAVIAEARRVLGCLQSSTHAHRPVLVLSPERQAWLLLELASAEMWAGDLDSAAVHVDEALLSARASDHPGLLALGLGHRAVGELLKSNARGAADTAAEGLTHAQRTGSADRCFTDRSHITLAWASYLRLEFDQAFESLSRIDLDAPGQVDTTVSILSSVLHAALLLEQGRLDEAQRELADPVGAAAALPSYLDRALALTRWRCASARGDGDAAAAEVRVLTKLGFDGDADVLSALARAELGDVDAGLETLSRVLTAAGPTDQASLARAATARTALLLLNGDRNAAQIAVLDVLARTAPQELLFFLTIGLLAGRDFLDLLADETKRAGAHPFAARALRSLREYVANRPHAIAASSPEIARAERRVRSETVDRLQPKGIRNRAVVVNGVNVTLTEREIDVLEQLALGSSYHEIGLALFITENTVKTHLASLYRKLGVERRSAALRVARDLGLV